MEKQTVTSLGKRDKFEKEGITSADQFPLPPQLWLALSVTITLLRIAATVIPPVHYIRESLFCGHICICKVALSHPAGEGGKAKLCMIRHLCLVVLLTGSEHDAGLHLTGAKYLFAPVCTIIWPPICATQTKTALLEEAPSGFKRPSNHQIADWNREGWDLKNKRQPAATWHHSWFLKINHFVVKSQ